MMEKRSGKLILHKFYQYLLPSIFLVVAMQIGSLANGIVIGQFIGEEALAAASLSVSFLYLIQLPALAIPPGLAIVLGNLFSKRKFLEATRAFNITFLFGLFLSLLFIPTGLLFIDQICAFLCGTFTDYIPYMKDYLLNYFLMAPLYFIGVMCVYVLSSDNKPRLSALFFVICTVVHIGLEIIFCICLPKDNIMIWVAWSGGFGMIAGLVVLIPYLLSKKRLLKFSFTKISFKDLIPVLKASLTTVLICLLTF